MILMSAPYSAVADEKYLNHNFLPSQYANICPFLQGFIGVFRPLHFSFIQSHFLPYISISCHKHDLCSRKNVVRLGGIDKKYSDSVFFHGRHLFVLIFLFMIFPLLKIISFLFHIFRCQIRNYFYQKISCYYSHNCSYF